MPADSVQPKTLKEHPVFKQFVSDPQTGRLARLRKDFPKSDQSIPFEKYEKWQKETDVQIENDFKQKFPEIWQLYQQDQNSQTESA